MRSRVDIHFFTGGGGKILGGIQYGIFDALEGAGGARG